MYLEPLWVPHSQRLGHMLDESMQVKNNKSKKNRVLLSRTLNLKFQAMSLGLDFNVRNEIWSLENKHLTEIIDRTTRKLDSKLTHACFVVWFISHARPRYPGCLYLYTKKRKYLKIIDVAFRQRISPTHLFAICILVPFSCCYCVVNNTIVDFILRGTLCTSHSLFTYKEFTNSLISSG